MAAQLFNRVGQLGLGVALVGGVVNSALYNGNKINNSYLHFKNFLNTGTQIYSMYYVLLIC